MAKKRTGHFSRMRKGKYLPLDGDPAATIYFEFTVDGRRKKVCCETSNEPEAREWVSKYLGFTTHCSSYERFLDTIISMGNMAKVEKFGLHEDENKMKVCGVWNAYKTSKRRPPSPPKTLNYYKISWTRFVEWLSGNRLFIEDVTQNDAEDYVAHLESKFKVSTCTRHMAQLLTIFRVVSSTENPFSGLGITKPDDRIHHRRLSLKECRALVKHAKGADERLLILIAYYTGLRMGHAAKMKAEQFDFKRGLYSFLQDDYQKGKEVPVLMPIHPALSIAIEQHMVEQNISAGFITPTAVRKYGTSGVTLSGAIMSIFKAAKVNETKEGTVGLHALRVTFKSQLEDASVSHTISSYLMGHSLGKMHKTYTRLEVSKIRKPLEAAIQEL